MNRGKYTQGLRWSGLRLLSAILALAIIAGACGSEAPNNQPIPIFTGLPGASEFVIGNNRFPFGLLGPDNQLIENAQVRVGFSQLNQEVWVQKDETDAIYRQTKSSATHIHEGGEVHVHHDTYGFYVVDRVVFDDSGVWQAEFQIASPSLSHGAIGSLAFEVKGDSKVPKIGDRVPESHHLTSSQVQSLTEITSHSSPVNSLYEISIAEALRQRRPLVVVFATPGFCTTRMCGPVTDMVGRLSEVYNNAINFIHIEPWNLDLARSQGQLRPTQVFSEWNLATEPWVFVVDSDGQVVIRYEGLVSQEEIEITLDTLLKDRQAITS